VGLGSVRGMKGLLPTKVNRRVLGICALCDTIVIVLHFPHS
jgi:hypothetical protein